MFVLCKHNNSAEQCHRCTSIDDPPAGYHYDWTICSTCWRDRRTHDLVEAKLLPRQRHRFTPRLKQGSTTPPLPGQHLYRVK